MQSKDRARDGFRVESRYPAPGALARARTRLFELAPEALTLFDNWTSLACLCDTGWLALGRPSSAMARIVRRRLRVLTSLPLSFATFAARPAGDGPVHLRGRCAALPGHGGEAPLWSTDARDGADGRVLIEIGRDFLLSIDGGDVYVLSNGGHLASATPLCAGDDVSVFGFSDEVLDRWGLASGVHGRGGVLPAIRSGSELPLLLTRSRGEPASSARRGPSREGSGTL
ncbi:MAG TPA: hypothetical protein VN903_31285 [Polyangia bacterium]|nr:hypothetical protein [Polyangia bacterium]